MSEQRCSRLDKLTKPRTLQNDIMSVPNTKQCYIVHTEILLTDCTNVVSKISVTSTIVINMPTRELLAGETNFFCLTF